MLFWGTLFCVSGFVILMMLVVKSEDFRFSFLLLVASILLVVGELTVWLACVDDGDYTPAEVVAVSEDHVYFETERGIMSYETSSPEQYSDAFPYLLMIENDGTVSVVWRCAE